MIKRLLILACFLFSLGAWAGDYNVPFRPRAVSGVAWAHVGDLGTGTSASAGTTVDVTTSAALESGNIGVCIVAKDEAATISVDGSGHAQFTSITDSASNTWTEVGEYCNTGNGTAANGVCVTVYYTKATSTLNSGATITATIVSATAKSITCKEFTGGTVSVATGLNYTVNDVTDAGAMTVDTTVNREHLFIRGIGCENNFTYTADSDYTTFTSAITTGTSVAAIGTHGEWRIATESTSASSDPTTSTCDNANMMFALDSN